MAVKISKIVLLDEKNKDYIASEKHYQDLVKSGWAAGENDYYDKPNTLGEAGHNLRLSLKEFSEALGYSRFMDKVLILFGRLILKLRKPPADNYINRQDLRRFSNCVHITQNGENCLKCGAKL